MWAKQQQRRPVVMGAVAVPAIVAGPATGKPTYRVVEQLGATVNLDEQPTDCVIHHGRPESHIYIYGRPASWIRSPGVVVNVGGAGGVDGGRWTVLNDVQAGPHRQVTVQVVQQGVRLLGAPTASGSFNLLPGFGVVVHRLEPGLYWVSGPAEAMMMRPSV